jgi:hypothetical protein
MGVKSTWTFELHVQPDFPALPILTKQFHKNNISRAAHAEDPTPRFQPITAIVVQPLSKMVLVAYNSRKQHCGLL